MKGKASVSHDESMARELRENPDFAAEYLRGAMEDEAEPRALLTALRRITMTRFNTEPRAQRRASSETA